MKQIKKYGVAILATVTLVFGGTQAATQESQPMVENTHIKFMTFTQGGEAATTLTGLLSNEDILKGIRSFASNPDLLKTFEKYAKGGDEFAGLAAIVLELADAAKNGASNGALAELAAIRVAGYGLDKLSKAAIDKLVEKMAEFTFLKVASGALTLYKLAYSGGKWGVYVVVSSLHDETQKSLAESETGRTLEGWYHSGCGWMTTNVGDSPLWGDLARIAIATGKTVPGFVNLMDAIGDLLWKLHVAVNPPPRLNPSKIVGGGSANPKGSGDVIADNLLPSASTNPDSNVVKKKKPSMDAFRVYERVK